MNKWLNGRFKDRENSEHELFESEDRTNAALARTLAAHRQKKRVVTEKTVGGSIRYEVLDERGFVAVHWLSDERAT